jgi:hypothetical protein
MFDKFINFLYNIMTSRGTRDIFQKLGSRKQTWTGWHRYLGRCFGGWVGHSTVNNSEEADVIVSSDGAVAGPCAAVKNQPLVVRDAVEGP